MIMVSFDSSTLQGLFAEYLVDSQLGKLRFAVHSFSSGIPPAATHYCLGLTWTPMDVTFQRPGEDSLSRPGLPSCSIGHNAVSPSSGWLASQSVSPLFPGPIKTHKDQGWFRRRGWDPSLSKFQDGRLPKKWCIFRVLSWGGVKAPSTLIVTLTFLSLSQSSDFPFFLFFLSLLLAGIVQAFSLPHIFFVFLAQTYRPGSNLSLMSKLWRLGVKKKGKVPEGGSSRWGS